MTKVNSVDAYIAHQPKAIQPVLERVRSIIRRAIPDAEETISYQIPAYKLGGKNVVFFAGWKNHFSVYPIGARVAEALAKELEAFERSKGTIRFPLDQPVPARLIGRIARLRAKEARDEASKRKRR